MKKLGDSLPDLPPPPKISPTTRRLIEASAHLADGEPDELTFQHTVLCQTALPYRRTPDRVWERQQGAVFLQLQAGSLLDPHEEVFVDQPLPFGEKARLVMMHLNAEALRQGSATIEVADSMTAFVRDLLHRPPNARELNTVRAQLNALAGSTIRLGMIQDGHAIQAQGSVVSALDLWYPAEPGQRVLWGSSIRLSEEYFASLTRHAVPLAMDAVRALSHSAMALDVYTWLAQRLHRVSPRKPVFIPWPAVHEQFGHGYKRIRAFREFFQKVAKQVLVVYPDAKIDVDGRGVTLRHSPPPIAQRSPSSGRRTLNF